jgi:hypothetical protein
MAKKHKKTAKSSGTAPEPTALEERRAPHAGSKQSAAMLAAAVDGTLFLNIGALRNVDAADLVGRTFFIGVELKGGERLILQSHVDEAGCEVSARIGGALRKEGNATTKME